MTASKPSMETNEDWAMPADHEVAPGSLRERRYG
jgi:hypothetical protein